MSQTQPQTDADQQLQTRQALPLRKKQAVISANFLCFRCGSDRAEPILLLLLRYLELLFCHMEDKAYAETMKVCKQFGEKEPNLWIHALSYFAKYVLLYACACTASSLYTMFCFLLQLQMLRLLYKL